MQLLGEYIVLIIMLTGALIGGVTCLYISRACSDCLVDPPPPRFQPLLAQVYRSSRPRSIADLYYFKARHITTIVSLEEGWGHLFGYSSEEMYWRDMGYDYKQFGLSYIFPPTRTECEVISKLILDSAKNGNVLFHCFSGVDRTGFIAAYTMVKALGVLPEVAWQANCVNMGMHLRYRIFWKKAFLRICAEERDTVCGLG